jgi:hypothetical protein
MKPWRWFVGQVARLRRSIMDAFALRRRHADEEAAPVDEPRDGPPEHWLEKVRRGAPGLLEPSFRQQNGSAPAPERVLGPEADLAPPTDTFEQPEREDAPSPTTPPKSVPLLRKVLRRKHSPRVAEARRAPEAGDSPSELPADTRRIVQTPPAAQPPRRIPLDEPSADQPERSLPPPEVVELETPAQRRPARVEHEAAPQGPRNGHPAKRIVEEIRTERVWERSAPSPAPKSEPAAQRLPERAAARPTPRTESPVEPRPTRTPPAEPLPSTDVHPWPELPAPIDHDDSDVEAALRAWEHQQRLDREQTRL